MHSSWSDRFGRRMGMASLACVLVAVALVGAQGPDSAPRGGQEPDIPRRGDAAAAASAVRGKAGETPRAEFAGPQPRTIFLTRHAHRESLPIEPFSEADIDQALSCKGRVQAKHLAEILRTNEIRAVYTTQFLRTRETAQPLIDLVQPAVKSLPMRPEIRTDSAALESYVKESLATILAERPTGNILIVGHDATIEEFLKVLLPDSTPVQIMGFGDLFVVGQGSPRWPPSIKY